MHLFMVFMIISSFVTGAWRFVQKRIGAAREAFHRINEEIRIVIRIIGENFLYGGSGPKASRTMQKKNLLGDNKNNDIVASLKVLPT